MAAAGAPVRVPVAVALRVLGLSRQGYYQWLKARLSQRDWDDVHLIDVLYDLQADDVTLGYRFLADELEIEHGITASENRVHRLCRIAGIHASHHRKRSKPGSTGPAPHDDLLAVVDKHGVIPHEFVANGPNKVWLRDISEHPTREGKLYICAIKDVWSNKIVGYSIDTRMKSSLARAAMRNAIALRSPHGTICHSDRGGQFRAKRTQNLPFTASSSGYRGRLSPIGRADGTAKAALGGSRSTDGAIIWAWPPEFPSTSFGSRQVNIRQSDTRPSTGSFDNASSPGTPSTSAVTTATWRCSVPSASKCSTLTKSSRCR